LTAEGFAVETVSNGLALVQRALVLRPDVILTDVWMPTLSGIEAITYLRADTRTATDCIADLARPFSHDSVQVRPGTVAGDGTATIALPYVDWRLYAERLDQVVGVANWSIQLIPWGATRIIARLTILGISKDAYRLQIATCDVQPVTLSPCLLVFLRQPTPLEQPIHQRREQFLAAQLRAPALGNRLRPIAQPGDAAGDTGGRIRIVP
jgi:CheY-like chemotaxis protein